METKTKKAANVESQWVKRITLLLEESGQSVAGFADKAGLDKSLLYSYISGTRKPAAESLLAIASAANVSIDWLAGRPGAAREYGDKAMLQSVQAGITEATGLMPVPVYEVEEAKAGHIKLVESGDEKAWLWISRSWAERYGKSNLSIIRAAGESMVPKIEPGSLILVNMAEKSRGEGLRIVQMGDGLLVKHCEPRPRGAIRMVSENMEYDSFTAKTGEYEVVGAVVAIIKIVEPRP